MSALNDHLIDAHGRDDFNALVELYIQAADQAHITDAQAFYLTQAYVFALQMAHPLTGDINRRLVEMGREVALSKEFLDTQ